MFGFDQVFNTVGMCFETLRSFSTDTMLSVMTHAGHSVMQDIQEGDIFEGPGAKGSNGGGDEGGSWLTFISSFNNGHRLILQSSARKAGHGFQEGNGRSRREVRKWGGGLRWWKRVMLISAAAGGEVVAGPASPEIRHRLEPGPHLDPTRQSLASKSEHLHQHSEFLRADSSLFICQPWMNLNQPCR